MVFIRITLQILLATSWLVQGDPPETVDKLDLLKYNGSWYQVYYNQYVERAQQQDQMCIVVKYGYVNTTSILATQYSRMGTPFGSEMKTKSKIIRPDDKTPGSFQVLVSGEPYPTPYLVIKLGPVSEKTNLYEYSVVTDSDMVSLLIFARDVQKFHTHYQDDVIKFCRDQGFSSYYNQPIPSPQPAACKYYNDEDDLINEDLFGDGFPQVIRW